MADITSRPDATGVQDNTTNYRTTLDLQAAKKKFSPSASTANADAGAKPQEPVSSGDVAVKRVRAKDRNQDTNVPAPERTIILDDKGLLGSQG